LLTVVHILQVFSGTTAETCAQEQARQADVMYAPLFGVRHALVYFVFAICQPVLRRENDEEQGRRQAESDVLTSQEE
jgi:hypothetical protein